VFTVIIPTRDRTQFLAQAIASVRAQTGASAEVIVVNDGAGPVSADARVLDNLRRGPVAARNRGVEAARGDLIAFLDDDDWWTDPDHLARAEAALAGDPFYFADGDLVFEDGSQSLAFSRAASAMSLARDNTILISAVCYRKSLHGTLGPFDVDLPYYWDWDWYLRVARSGAGLVHHAEPSVAIRVHAGNMSGAGTEAARRDNLARFAAKHGLAGLELKNHLMIAREGAEE
jgi:glycosyltransferase involved in cell wall biosynthesis